MIFVNTSLDVALERNAERARKLDEPLVVQSWKDVQKNIGKFNNFFKQNFIFIDNNDACKIFNFSISLTEATPIENKELFLISFDISILCSKVSFFESFKFFIWWCWCFR